MSRINQNISSMQAMRSLNRNNTDLSTRLQRLATGLKINTGKDAPAGLIASEKLRSEITGISQAIDNTTRASNVVNTAEGSLTEVSSLLLELQSLTIEAANTGALSNDEINANQLQVDSIINSINRIANTTQFGGRKLLNGSLGYSTSGVAASSISAISVNSAKLPDNGTMQVNIIVTNSAELAEVGYTGGALVSSVTLEIAGVDGTEQVSLGAGSTVSAILDAINQYTTATGVSATLSGADIRINSTEYGTDKFIAVRSLSGTFTTTGNRDNGLDASVSINGVTAQVKGKIASIRTPQLDLEVDLSAAMASNTSTAKTLFVTGGGMKFQIGSEVNRPGQYSLGLNSIAASQLGNGVTGYLSSILTGGTNSLVSGNTTQAQKIISESISMVSELRGRLGALQKNVFETNINSLGVTMENVTASESAIRDADFAKETAALTRAQILSQANTSVLSQANAIPQQVLSLLGR